MIEKLEHRIDDITSLNSKLVLLVGPPGSGKSGLLAQLSERRDTPVLSVGATLGRQLLTIPSMHRHLQAADLLKEIVDKTAHGSLLLLDNIELLFDRTLLLNPLALLKKHARARSVVSVWPGEIRENRLSYATTEHPEHRDYGIDGLIPFMVY